MPERKLTATAGVPTGLVKWQSMIDGHPVALSAELVNTLFKGSHPFTPQECYLFIQECKARGADPIAKDMYPIKYEAGKPASFVTSYHFLMALAQRDPHYDGFNLWYVDNKGEKIPQGLETVANVVAAICRVKNKRRSPTEFVARMKEFNKSQAMWKSMPVHMLGKVAIAGAHRQVIGTAVHVAEEYGTVDEAGEVGVIPEVLAEPAPEEATESPESAKQDKAPPPDEGRGEKGDPDPRAVAVMDILRGKGKETKGQQLAALAKATQAAGMYLPRGGEPEEWLSSLSNEDLDKIVAALEATD